MAKRLVPKEYYRPEAWQVSEEGFQPELNQLHETIFCLGNGYMGVRATPEEGAGEHDTVPGTYVGLVYEKLDTVYSWVRVNFAVQRDQAVNCLNWIWVKLSIDGTPFDPCRGKVLKYRRTLDLKSGLLCRTLVWEDEKARRTEFEIKRIVCMDKPHLAAIKYSFKPLNYSAPVSIEAGLDGDARFGSPPACLWQEKEKGSAEKEAVYYCASTGRTKILLVSAMRLKLKVDGQNLNAATEQVEKEKYIGQRMEFKVEQDKTYCLEKIVSICTSRDMEKEDPKQRAVAEANTGSELGFDGLFADHRKAWEKIWQDNDVVIEGDLSGQQGIRYSVFQMQQNYSGRDPRVNIGAKGMTGEGYGGWYFWDTEIYMMPYFLYTDPEKARKLLMYRYHTLDHARQRAKQFRYSGAMFPWATIDGTESAPPWEYMMLEQHVNVAIPYGIWHYVEATGDRDFLYGYGAEIVLENCRFWQSRVTWNRRREKYMINGVTGPDEYKVLINNNCYTNSMTRWVLRYGLEIINDMKKNNPGAWKKLAEKIRFGDSEPGKWADIIKKIHIPYEKSSGIYPQDDTFMDMDEIDIRSIPPDDRPIVTHWAWERIMRHQVIKQPDVLLLLYLLNDEYPAKAKKVNYDYYEPRTIHESSLSPCIHSIMASETGYREKAFEYYLKTARLDLGNINYNSVEGIHIANMAGSWLSIVNGFAGMRLSNGMLNFSPVLPEKWNLLQFRVKFLDRLIEVSMKPGGTDFRLIKGKPVRIGLRKKIGTVTIFLKHGTK